MHRRIGRLTAEVMQGEGGGKFTASLVLLHGLWGDARVWRPFVGFLGHRGWTATAVNLRGRAGSEPASGIEQHLSDLRQAVATLDAPPVVVGHDLGGLLALHLTEARAIVALAPLVPLPLSTTPLPALQRAGSMLERWRGQPLRAPRGAWRGDYVEDPSIRESVDVVRDLTTKPWMPPALPAEVPGLVLAGGQDRVVDPDSVGKLAVAIGAELELCSAAGHAMLSDSGWEERVSLVHRWLIRKLGAPLLAFYEEAMNPEE
jgi:pimeloyl-ACP methyl ester carboxylesterase